MGIALTSYTINVGGGGMQISLAINGNSHTAFGNLSELTELIIELKKVRLAMILQHDPKIAENIEEKIVAQEQQIRSILVGGNDEVPF